MSTVIALLPGAWDEPDARINNPPVDRIPNEVLVQIFKLVVLSETRGPTYRLRARDICCRDTARFDTLVLLTHICQRWREAIVGCPTFWTRVDGRRTTPSRVLLSRSQTAPLSLFMSKEWKQYPRIIAAEGHRLRRLDLTITSVVRDNIRSLLRFNSDVLECLTISYAPTAYRSEASHAALVTLFDHVPQSLKALAIDNFRDWFPSDRFHALTHLYLCLNSFVDLTSSRHLLALLSHTPKLEFLHVNYLVADVSAWGTPICLTSIRSLVLFRATLEAAASFLSYLKLSDSALVRVDEFESSMPIMPIIKLAGITDSVTRLAVGRSFREVRFVAEGRDCGLWVQGSFVPSGQTTSWLKNMVATLPLPRITQLQTSIANDDTELLLSLLSQMAFLTELEMKFTTIYGARLMSIAISSDTPRLCPVLESLTLDICTDIDHDVHRLDPDEFYGLIAGRARCGHPLRRVTVQLYSRWSTDAAPQDITSRFEPLAHADVLEVRSLSSSSEPPQVSLFWNVYDSERYWDLDDHEKADSNVLWP